MNFPEAWVTVKFFQNNSFILFIEITFVSDFIVLSVQNSLSRVCDMKKAPLILSFAYRFCVLVNFDTPHIVSNPTL